MLQHLLYYFYLFLKNSVSVKNPFPGGDIMKINKKSQYIIMIVIIISFFSALVALYNIYVDKFYKQDMEFELDNISISYKYKVEKYFNFLKSIESIVLLQYENLGDSYEESPEIQNFLSYLFEGSQNLINISFAPNGIQKFVVPVPQENVVKNHNLFEDTRPWIIKDIKNAMESEKPIVSNPYELRQGGFGIVLRKSVFYGEKFLGLANIVIDFSDFADLLLNTNKNYHFILGHNGEFIYGNSEGHNPAKMMFKSISIKDNEFEIYVCDDMYRQKNIFFRFIFYILVILSAVTLILYITKSYFFNIELNKKVSLRTQKLREKAEELEAAYEEIYASEEELRYFNEEIELKNSDLKKRIEERETLIKEINHRVKNNLQLINSLISLQEFYMDKLDKKSILENIKRRIYSLSFVYEKFYKSESIEKLNVKNFIEDEINYLINSTGKNPSGIKTAFDISEIYMNLEILIPLSLVINEIISNSLIHGIPYAGIISCMLHVKENKIIFILGDNGKGLPDDFDILKSDSLGIQIINSMISQMNGKLNIKNSDGLYYEIKFDYNE